MAWSFYFPWRPCHDDAIFYNDHDMILPWSYHSEYDSPWSYHVIAWSSRFTMAVKPVFLGCYSSLSTRLHEHRIEQLHDILLQLHGSSHPSENTWIWMLVIKKLLESARHGSSRVFKQNISHSSCVNDAYYYSNFASRTLPQTDFSYKFYWMKHLILTNEG